MTSLQRKIDAGPDATRPRIRRRRLATIWLAGGLLVPLLAAIVAVWLARPDASRASQRERIVRAAKYLGEGKPSEALRAVRPILGQGPDSGEALAVAGMALAVLDRRAEARGVLERALERQPKQPMAHKVLAAIYLSCGDYERGLAHLRSAADLDPSDARPWIAMGKAYHDLGRDEESADSYQAACHRDPASHEARLGIVAAALKIGRPDRATPHLVEALREAPEDPRFLGLAARHALALGHPEQAAGFAGRALARDPDNFDALVARATYLSLQGEPKGALEDLERAVAINPISVETLRLLAQVESRLGLTQRARETVSRAQSIADRFVQFDRLAGEIARRPDDPEPRWRMGQVAAQANMPEIAVNSFQAALAIDPHCQPARAGLAAIRTGQGGTPPSR